MRSGCRSGAQVSAGAKISQETDEFAAADSQRVSRHVSVTPRCRSPIVGNGVFGGLVLAAGASIAAITGIPLSSLFYPIAIIAIGVIVSRLFLREPTHHIRTWAEIGGDAPPVVPDQP